MKFASGMLGGTLVMPPGNFHVLLSPSRLFFFGESVSLSKITSQRFHKENKMKILVALIAVFMVLGALAQKAPSYFCEQPGTSVDPSPNCSQVGQFTF